MTDSRYRWLERQLDRDDLTDDEFTQYNRELNALQDEKNQRAKEQEIKREARLKEEAEELALEKIMSLTEEQVEKMYIDTCLKYQDVNGMSFKAWYEQSLKYYTIDDKFTVHSRARSPKDENVDSVPCPTMAQAKLRVLILIRTKFRDHAERGYDFKWQ